MTDLIRFANMRRSEDVPRRSLTVRWQLLWRGNLPFVTPQNWDALRRRESPKVPDEKSSTFHERR